MELYEKQAKFAQDVSKLIQYIFDKGMLCSLGEAYRTPQQAFIYSQQHIGIENSLHCKRLAVDINLISSEGFYFKNTSAYGDLGRYWESLDSCNKWGGNFGPTEAHPHQVVDGNHFQRDE